MVFTSVCSSFVFGFFQCNDFEIHLHVYIFINEYGCTTPCLPTHLLMNTCVLSSSEPLQIKLLKHLCTSLCVDRCLYLFSVNTSEWNDWVRWFMQHLRNCQCGCTVCNTMSTVLKMLHSTTGAVRFVLFFVFLWFKCICSRIMFHFSILEFPCDSLVYFLSLC